MNYVTERERYAGSGTTEKVLDMKRFAKDLAKEMGGTLDKPPESGYDAERYASFKLGDETIGLTAGWKRSELEKVTVTINPKTRVPYGFDRPDAKLPDAMVSVSRPLAAIAKDITRRVLEPAKAPLAIIRDILDKRTNDIATLKNVAAEIKAKGFEVRMADDATYSGDFYAKGYDLSGRFNVNGRVDIKSMDNLTMTMFDKIVKARNGK